MVQGGLLTAHPEASMVVEKLSEVNPPSGRVPGRDLLCSRSWKHDGGGTKRKFAMQGSLRGFSERGVKIGRTGRQRWATWRGQGGGRATRAPGCLVGPPSPP